MTWGVHPEPPARRVAGKSMAISNRVITRTHVMACNAVVPGRCELAAVSPPGAEGVFRYGAGKGGKGQIKYLGRRKGAGRGGKGQFRGRGW